MLFTLHYTKQDYIINTDFIHHIDCSPNEDYESSIATIYMNGYKENKAHIEYGYDESIAGGTDTIIDSDCIFPVYDKKILNAIVKGGNNGRV